VRTPDRLLVALFASSLLIPGVSHAWTRGYVVVRFEPALHYLGDASGAANSAGADCENGVSDMDQRAAFTRPYRPAEKVNFLMSAEVSTNEYNSTLGFRGPNKELVYSNPTIMPDSGTREVTSKVSEGLNLDDNEATGFMGVEGDKGVDNNYYRVAGCSYRFRAPKWTASPFESRNGYMQDGSYTFVMVLTGHQDPMNDNDVTVGYYYSPDKMVKDSLGAIAQNYTFRAGDDPRFQSVFKAKITNGVIESTDRPTVTMYDLDGLQFPLLQLVQSKIRLKIQPDGSIEGVMAGYRDWAKQFVQNYPTHERGGAYEKLGHTDAVAFYHALRRRADGVPDAQGRMTAISTAYRFKMQPAYVTTPIGNEELTVAKVLRK